MVAFVRAIFLVTALFAILALLSGCGSGKSKFVPPPPPEVVVSAPVERNVTDYLEFTGNVAAFESVEIRARVEGVLEKINFKPDARVNAGDLLFVIDPKPFQAQVDEASARLQAKSAARDLAQVQFDKAKQLYDSASISEIQYLEQKAKRDMAEAEVSQAKADLEKAQLNLGYTSVISPINGRVSRNLVDVGNLVGAVEKTLLTTVVNDDVVYAYFNVSEADLLVLARKYPPEDRGRDERPSAPAMLALADESGFPHQGQVDYVDNKVDPNTGTIQARAVFENKSGILIPGLFARVRVPLDTRKAYLVPDVAVGIDQGGRYVLVVGADNVVDKRPVTVGHVVDRMRVIDKGLGPNDQVIVNGMQRARPGGKVTPVKPTSAPTGEPAGTRKESPQPAPPAR
ncbi:MAG: efflux RND transporter periplasmic adaptor subunit [Desulfomonile sp.]|nr:efflux RND transporter periplasmic adaptor subunit [Desulfomonile sp.]